jgi:hypothetical protein
MYGDKINITQKYLKSILDYDSVTGIFKWKAKLCNRITIGLNAGCLDKYGYVVIRINYRLYYAHRLAWLYIYGHWPNNLIDHINMNKLDNSIKNIRISNKRLNAINTEFRKTGRLAGTYKQGNRWQSYIHVKNKKIHLDYFDTERKAHNAYKKAVSNLKLGLNHNLGEIR